MYELLASFLLMGMVFVAILPVALFIYCICLAIGGPLERNRK